MSEIEIITFQFNIFFTSFRRSPPPWEKISALVKCGLIRSLHKRLPFCKVKIVFKTSNCLKNYFSFKDIVPKLLRSCQIYNFTYGS